MRARWWDQRDQPLEKLAGLEDDVSRAVAPAALELVAEKAIGLCREPRGDGHVCMQADAVDHRAAFASRRFEVVRSNAVADARYAPAGARPRRGSVSDRGDVELTEHTAIARERVCLVGTR